MRKDLRDSWPSTWMVGTKRGFAPVADQKTNLSTAFHNCGDVLRRLIQPSPTASRSPLSRRERAVFLMISAVALRERVSVG
jgi:hypothetical protein